MFSFHFCWYVNLSKVRARIVMEVNIEGVRFELIIYVVVYFFGLDVFFIVAQPLLVTSHLSEFLQLILVVIFRFRVPGALDASCYITVDFYST